MVNLTTVPCTLLSVSSCWKGYQHGECHHSTTHCCQCQTVGKGGLDYQHGERHHSTTHCCQCQAVGKDGHSKSHHSTTHSVVRYWWWVCMRIRNFRRMFVGRISTSARRYTKKVHAHFAAVNRIQSNQPNMSFFFFFVLFF